MTRRAPSAVVPMLVALAVAPACSLSIRTAPSPVDPRVEPTCTLSRARPVADLAAAPAILGAGLVAGVIAGGRRDDGLVGPVDARIAAAGIIGAVALAGIGFWGVRQVGRCHGAWHTRGQWINMGKPADLAVFEATRRRQRARAARLRCQAWMAAVASAQTTSEIARLDNLRPPDC